jgi:uncharacterized protein
MEVKVCKNCRRMFKYIYGPEICQECLKALSKEEKDLINQDVKASVIRPKILEEKELYEKVKDYIMAHPKANISQISDANGVTPKQLMEWVREERLEFSDESTDAWFTCMKCGVKIKSGRLCNRCKHTY